MTETATTPVSEFPVIAWDIDDVLNHLTAEWFEAFCLERSVSNLAYEDMTENPPHRLFGIEIDEYKASLDRFRFAQFAGLQPDSEVMRWFKEHGEKFSHITVSAVPLKCSHLSAEWVVRNFGPWMRSYNFVPSFRPNTFCPAYDRNKGDALERFNRVDLFIDDAEENIAAASQVGIQTALFPAPWNSNRGMPVSDFLTGLLKLLRHE